MVTAAGRIKPLLLQLLFLLDFYITCSSSFVCDCMCVCVCVCVCVFVCARPPFREYVITRAPLPSQSCSCERAAQR